ncbi:outer membrane beta-barrel protein [Chryseolinea sp. T2]|uniref:outer membrane beta-barrel protein n=1 Tax=Chryseolinea sp. T2 TaxID=3129255 RepID=UPI0030789BEE
MFKRSSSESATTYYPGDVKLYGFTDNKVLESRKVTVDNIERWVFLEVVVRGTVTLFKFNDMFWVEKEGKGFHYLSNNIAAQYSVNGQDRTKIRNDNRHIGTLNIMMYDCPSVKRDIEKVQLTKRSLTALVSNYNKCIGDVKAVTYQSKKRWAQAKFGMLAGANISRLKVNSSGDPDTDVNGPSQWVTSMIIGPTMDLYFPRAGERFAFTTGLLYFGATYDMHFTTQMRSGSKTWTLDDYITVDIKQLQIPLGARYSFPSRKIAPYLIGGVMFVRNLALDSDWKQELTFNSEVKVYDKDGFVYKSIQVGCWGGFGILAPLTNKLAGVVELRADVTNGITPRDAGSVTSTVTNYKVVVGIRMR